jgi:hypothetical protein
MALLQLNYASNFTVRNDRAYPVGPLYGYSDLQPDHYNNWKSEMDNQQENYHAVFPIEQTYKLLVDAANLAAPNYRLAMAIGNGYVRRYNYMTGWLTSTAGPYSPLNSGYADVDLHDDAVSPPTGPVSYLNRYNQPNYQVKRNAANNWLTAQWYLKLYNRPDDQSKWDDIRIIPDNGHYRSPGFNASVYNNGGPVTWGTASWTLTIPSTANAVNEVCSIQADTGSGLFNVSLNGPLNAVSPSLAYRVNFTTTDVDYSETPVLEDITVTYLPKAKVIYRRDL